MRFRKNSEADGPKQYAVDPMVPPVAAWPLEGIVGRIGRGAERGEWVLAEPYWDAVVGNGPAAGYSLELPRRQLFDLDGNHLLDDGCYDDFRASGEGGVHRSADHGFGCRVVDGRSGRRERTSRTAL
ncbi:hypothetical protein G5T42_17160 [Microbacterium sp. 4R-513]|uniref:hypothetical protein n=1 Tax=Microbacterium sp. 4R-513 TaxID=2567934 RepID=UPI0013E1B5FE|nr:hypothetical protein [Microbacterium sp. 4R-513]QIG40988.1 hypothetical protein G5T42_17160 [Microbacterium sp. 4R-513]